MGIDDPLEWMDNSDPRILDWWIAHRWLGSDERSGKTDDDPETAMREHLATWQRPSER